MEQRYSAIETAAELERLIADQPAAAVYFSGSQCGVCEALRPKIAELIHHRFPRLGFYVVDSSAHVDIAAAHSVFSVPTLLVFFEGREWLRKSRNLSLSYLEAEISRPYALMFDDAAG